MEWEDFKKILGEFTEEELGRMEDIARKIYSEECINKDTVE